MPGGDWGFLAAIKNRAIKTPPVLSNNQAHQLFTTANEVERTMFASAIGSHSRSWINKSSKAGFNRWRYVKGWQCGWHDARTFYQGTPIVGSGNRIGMLELWILKRIRDSGLTETLFMCEFEQGLRRGISDFDSVVSSKSL